MIGLLLVEMIIGYEWFISGLVKVVRGDFPSGLAAAVLFFTVVAAIGGAFLAINFHLANGASHPWLIPGDSFDEGIDLDSVLPAIQIVIAWISIILFRRLGRERPGGTRADPGAS